MNTNSAQYNSLSDLEEFMSVLQEKNLIPDLNIFLASNGKFIASLAWFDSEDMMTKEVVSDGCDTISDALMHVYTSLVAE